ncbi:hypothetical protein TspCOW1_16520 [Thiohalobacter sp. COW1]|uniref:Uncharacterized protein n=1 Tax=Thiohalobacter thiocyanaticus TaxID=585455 RepID=A0A1Z4VP56_9GAMM|nr:uncharacterized protein FOKN1_1009 [Thiohalobacter thiocyanaticus]BCO31549.1 hypothetical protein TspCOW1_16520 [Thiohalobacter sp. COW1]
MGLTLELGFAGALVVFLLWGRVRLLVHGGGRVAVQGWIQDSIPGTLQGMPRPVLGGDGHSFTMAVW